MLRLYNTLTRKVGEFVPLEDNLVKMYSCGPTVYDYQHIGHMRRYVGDDILVRVLQANGYKVKHVMNITDVGHLVSDEDTGEDKMEKGAKKYGKSVWELAKMFEEQFWKSTDALNILRPSPVMHATDYIAEQIKLVKQLEEKRYTYTIEDGVYFDTSKFPDYFKLSRQNPAELKKGARVEFVEGKRNPSDFALWKFSPKSEKRQMEWESPWGVGFPGWHIECSAMSMKALGNTLDIHTGGIDHIAIHHTNEIAQSECATGQKFVNYWVHHNFLVVENQKMSKSLGNFITVQDVVAKGYDPLSLRYLYLQTHYRQEMNFTWEALDAAEKVLKKLQRHVLEMKKHPGEAMGTKSIKSDITFIENWFNTAINDDLNVPQAMGALWTLIDNGNIKNDTKLNLILKFDHVLGFNLDRVKEEAIEVPSDVLELVQSREEFRKAGDWAAADETRKKIQDLGFMIQDTPEGPQLTPLKK